MAIASSKVELSRMSWTEAEAAARDKRTVLIPVGCLEQHGPHLPLGADSTVAEYYAVAVAREAGAVVMPTLHYGWSPFFRGFTGSLSIRPSTLEALLTDLVEGLLEQGFDHIVFVSNHASNEPMCEHVAREVKRRHGIILGLVFPWRLMQDLATELHKETPGAWGHGGEPETSVMLQLTPEDVDMSVAVRDTLRPFQGLDMDGWGKIRFNGFWAGVYVDSREVSDTGVKGNPLSASAEKGRIALERAIAWGVEFLRRFAELDTHTPPTRALAESAV